jgi:mono/diheme cytochrome c family protein
MIRTVRRRPLFLLRLLMLVVVALGTAGGALASALGDLHELSHADHPALPHGSPEPDNGHDDEDTSARLLHALVHCGHCHGQGGVLAFAAGGWELLSAPVVATEWQHDVTWRAAPQDSPLRPPIQA